MNSSKAPRLRFVLLGLVLLTGQALLGQDQEPTAGYFINRDGDRVEGWFPRGVQANNLNGFLFSETEQGQGERIPLDSARVIFLGKAEQYLVYDLAVGNQLEYLVLRKLVAGAAELYGGSSSLRGGAVFLMREPEAREYLIDKRNLEGVVRVLAQRCPEIDPEAYRFQERQLIELTVAFNACLEAPGEVLVEPKPVDLRIGLRPYGYFPRLIIPESNFYGLGEYQTSAGVSAAASLAWVISPCFRLSAELSYLRILSRSDRVNVTPRNEPDTYAEVEIDHQYLELPLTVQYSLPIPLGSFRPFAEGGLYIGIPLSRELEQTLTFADASHNRFTPDVAFTEMNFGYTLGLGVGLPLADRLELSLLARWTQASSQMRTSSAVNAAPEIGFTNLRTDKLAAGLRLEWKL